MKKINKMTRDLFGSEEHSSYLAQINSLWSRVIILNNTFIIVNKLNNFPFHLFYPDNSPFWHFTKAALLERLILLAWNIVVDNSFEKGLTIKQIKNNIFQTLKNENDLKLISEYLKENKHESKLAVYEDRIRNIRHNFIAHYNYEKAWENTTISDQDKIDLIDLEKCINEINNYFNFLCFSENLSPFLPQYFPGATICGKPVKTDIEILLDNIVQNDQCYQMKENNPQRWELTKNKIDTQKLDIINKIRNENGLTSASS